MEWQGDENLVLYQLSSYNGPIVKALWATNKYNLGINKVDFDAGCNIVVLKTEWNGAITTVWHSNTSGHPYSGNNKNMWIVQDDGNFVGYPVTTSMAGITVSGLPFADTRTQGNTVRPGGNVNIIR